MAKEFTQNFYGKLAWKEVRDYVMKRDAYLCQDCLTKGMYTPAEEVHHIVWLTPDNINDPNITLNPNNLISLCKECHHERHNKGEHLGKKRNRRYKVDEFGRVTVTDTAPL